MQLIFVSHDMTLKSLKAHLLISFVILTSWVGFYFFLHTLLPISKSVGPILLLVYLLLACRDSFALAVILGWYCAANIVLVCLGFCQLFVYDLLQVPGPFDSFGVSRI